MSTISIHDAKTNLSKYIAAAKKGKPIYIGSFGKPEVVLTKISNKAKKSSTRDFSIAKGKIKAKPDAFSKQTESLVTKLMLDEE